ncbi:hypothetical protein D3C78_1557180 [compost metagenome]
MKLRHCRFADAVETVKFGETLRFEASESFAENFQTATMFRVAAFEQIAIVRWRLCHQLGEQWSDGRVEGNLTNTCFRLGLVDPEAYR